MNINDCWYKDRCTNKCTESCIRFKLIMSLFNLSKIPVSLWKYKKLHCDELDFEAFNSLTQLQSNIEDFVIKGRQLYLFSEHCGNGKTSWSIRLVWSYFDKIWHKSSFEQKAIFVSVQKFLYNCKRSISHEVEGFEELCDSISSVDLVIWDDLPCGKFTDYEHQILFQYIDDRINEGKANIFTGNHNRVECENLLGDKLTSRIFSDYVIEFKEGDKRGW